MNWLEYHEEPVTLHSGGRSHWLVRGDLIFADEKLRELVLDCWQYALEVGGWAKTPMRVYGIPRGGSPWAEALSKRMDARLLTEVEIEAVQQAEKTTEAVIPPIPTILVDDVVTTGTSLNQIGIAGPRLAVVCRAAYIPITAAWAKICLPLLED